MADDHVTKAMETYAALKREARERYPLDHVYALAGGKIVAAGETEQGVRQQLRSLGLRDQDVMVESVYPEGAEFAGYLGWITTGTMLAHLVKVMTPSAPPTSERAAS